MWVILLSDSIEQRRDNMISEIIGDVVNEKYIAKIGGNKKYSVCYSVKHALTYSTESGAKRVIEEFNKQDSIQLKQYFNKYNWVKEYKEIDKRRMEYYNR
jgi:hypothetical protein